MRSRQPEESLQFHAWQDHQDIKILSGDGTVRYYLERPLAAGRLSAQWDYRFLLGRPDAEHLLLTIRKE